MYQSFKENFIKLTSLLTTLNMFKLFKISYILGSKATFFSCAQVISPLSGLLFNRNLNIVIFLSRIILFTLNGFSPLFTLLYHIPSFCGALYFNTRSTILKSAIPILSIILFISNPNIIQSDIITKLYCLYFAIPLIITLINHKSIFLSCLASTFTIHSVGSILWLYTHKFDPALYRTLINIVWAERLLFAILMTLSFYAIKAMTQLLRKETLKLRLALKK